MLILLRLILLRANVFCTIITGLDFGLAAYQLASLRSTGANIVACVDMIAASGGYMLACVCHKIIAAPFSVVGSIGVMTEVWWITCC